MEWDQTYDIPFGGRTYFYVHVIDETPMGEDYLRLTHEGKFAGWYVGAHTKADVVTLANLDGQWDYAVPQAWYDANRQTIADCGGWVIWWYPPQGNIFGEPRFADTLCAEAKANALALLMAFEEVVNDES